MWRSKKFILTALLTVVVLGAILGGFAVARADDDNAALPGQNNANWLNKVAEIYEQKTGVAIDSGKLQEAFTEARGALADDARDRFLHNLVDEGKITQEQLDEYKAWLDARPQFPTDEYQEWLESRPDIPYFSDRDGQRGLMPFGGGLRGLDRFGKGFGRAFGEGFRSFCPPEAPVN